jgi:hypothetical protein
MMRLYGAIQKVEPQDDGTVRVHGIATSEAMDDQGETIWVDAIRAALPDYMRFPALREMHQLSAAGTTLEAEVGDDGTTRIVAHVVDPVAVAKVKNQVYRGFSIGGRVTQRDPGNPKTITGLVLSEISLVDRPANPEAVFDCWKASALSEALDREAELGRAAPAQAGTGRELFNPPIQIWACGVSTHHHRAKADAVKCLEMRSLGETDFLGPPALEAIPEFAPGKRKDALGADTATAEAECSDAPDGVPAKHGEADCADPAYPSADGEGRPSAETDEQAAARVRTADLLHTGKPNMPKLASRRLAKASHSQGDQALVDMALYACDKCLKIDGLSVAEREHMGGARDHLREAGAAPIQEAGQDVGSDVVHAVPPVDLPAADFSAADNAAVEAFKAFGVVAKAGGRRSRAHRNLMDVAHECVGKATDGMACSRPSLSCDAGIADLQGAEAGEVAKTGARHSAQTMEHLRAAHDHLISAGAQCGRGVESAGDEKNQSPPQAKAGGSALEPKKALPVADLAKVLAEERAEKGTLVRVLGEMLPMLDRLSKRVDDIASTPLPPLTIARGSVSVSKQQDGGGAADLRLSPDAIASALAKMSKEDQTLTLIKASYANPIRVLGGAADEP